MKKLLMNISVICLASFGFAGVSLAGVAPYVPMPLVLECNEVGTACVDDVTYEVELNCMDIDDTIEAGKYANDGFRGDLTVEDDAEWVLDVEWSEDASVQEPVWVDVCDADGDIEFLLKHEMKCTDAPQGSNKPGKNKDDGFAQVDFEIKLEEEVCTTELPL